MNEANKVKLGAFLLISTVLLVGAFISAGALRFLSPKIHAVTEVFTSVEGLTVGSPVKYLGMPVGKVTRMHMRGSNGRIIIYFDIFGDAVQDTLDPDSTTFVFNRTDVENLLDKNMLSCFVNASGLMGGSHLELVRNPETAATAKTVLPRKPKNIPENLCYIPSNPSHIGNAIQNVSRMLEEMKSIDWYGFAEKINGSLDNLNALLNKNELDAALQRFERIGSSLEKTAMRLEKIVTPQNIEQINAALNSFNQSTQNLLKTTTNQQVENTVKNLNSFLVSAKSIIDKTDSNAGNVHTELRTFIENLETTLIRLENNISVINRTLQDFSRDPAQIVRGKREPEL